MAGVVVALQVQAGTAWAVDGPVLVTDAANVSLVKADDGTATTTFTMENPSASELDIWAELGDIHDDDCKILSPTEDEPAEIADFRHTKVTVTFAAACDPDRQEGTDFIVHTSDSNGKTFELHATSPATSVPNWTALLTIYGLTALAAAVLLSLVWAYWKKHIPEGNDDNPPAKQQTPGGQSAKETSKAGMTLPELNANWKFSDSWAANATVVTAVFTGIFGAKDIVTDLFGDPGKSLISTTAIAAALSVGLAGLSPMLLQALRRRVDKREAKPVHTTPPEEPVTWKEVPAGLYVTPRGLLLAGMVTLTATGGQLGVILHQLVEVEFWSTKFSIGVAAVAAVLLIWYAIAASLQNLTTGATREKVQPEKKSGAAPVPPHETGKATAEATAAAMAEAQAMTDEQVDSFLRERGLSAEDLNILIVPAPVPAQFPEATMIPVQVPVVEKVKPAAIL